MDDAGVAKVALELTEVKLTDPDKYVVAILRTDVDGSSEGMAFVSELSEVSERPTWSFGGALHFEPCASITEIELRFYRNPAVPQDKQIVLNKLSPLCSCAFRLTQVDVTLALKYPDNKTMPLVTRKKAESLKQGDEDWVQIGEVTLSLGPARPDLPALVPINQLPTIPRISRPSAAQELDKLRGMAAEQLQALDGMGKKLSLMRKGLDVLEVQRGSLDKTREKMLEDNEGISRQLTRLQLPNLSDLDIEVMLSLPDGLKCFAQTLWKVQERWQRERIRTVATFKGYEEVKKALEVKRGLEERIETMKALHKEQKGALLAASEKVAEAEEVKSVVDRQQELVLGLEAKVREAVEARRANGGPAEAALEFGKLQAENDALRAKLERLAMKLRQEHPTHDPTDVLELELALKKKTEQVEKLKEERDALLQARATQERARTPEPTPSKAKEAPENRVKSAGDGRGRSSRTDDLAEDPREKPPPVPWSKDPKPSPAPAAPADAGQPSREEPPPSQPSQPAAEDGDGGAKEEAPPRAPSKAEPGEAPEPKPEAPAPAPEPPAPKPEAAEEAPPKEPPAGAEEPKEPPPAPPPEQPPPGAGVGDLEEPKEPKAARRATITDRMKKAAQTAKDNLAAQEAERHEKAKQEAVLDQMETAAAEAKRRRELKELFEEHDKHYKKVKDKVHHEKELKKEAAKTAGPDVDVGSFHKAATQMMKRKKSR